MLGKVNNMEERLNSYLNNLSNAVDEVRAGNENVKLPQLDLEAVCFCFFIRLIVEFTAET